MAARNARTMGARDIIGSDEATHEPVLDKRELSVEDRHQTCSIVSMGVILTTPLPRVGMYVFLVDNT